MESDELREGTNTRCIEDKDISSIVYVIRIESFSGKGSLEILTCHSQGRMRRNNRAVAHGIGAKRY